MTARFSHTPLPGFMFRDQELARIARVVAQGQSVLLVGIRNTGKTQLMKTALTRHVAQGQPHCAAYLDVQTLTALDEFYRQLLAALPKPLLKRAFGMLKSVGQLPDALLQWLRRHVDEVEGFGFSVNLHDPKQLTRFWSPLQLALETAVAESPAESLPLIGIDELPFMLENLLDHGVAVPDITAMLAGLRKLRAAGLRMLLGGSISMENLLTLNQIPHTVLGQLWREDVPPFTHEEAHQYLARELAGSRAAPHIARVLDGLPDHVPAHLGIAANVLAVADLRASADVDWALAHQVLPHIRGAFLPQFEERLGKHFPGAELALAEDLLDQVARHPDTGGRIDSTGLAPDWRRVLTKLQADMFLRDAPHLGYRFALNLLRQWWRASRGMA